MILSILFHLIDNFHVAKKITKLSVLSLYIRSFCTLFVTVQTCHGITKTRGQYN